jgi:hypothetical protein
VSSIPEFHKLPGREFSGERRKAFSIVGRIVFVRSSGVTNVDMKSRSAFYKGEDERIVPLPTSRNRP